MNKQIDIIILSMLALVSVCKERTYSQSFDTIYSQVYDSKSDLHESNLEKYKTNEFWGVWSFPIGNPESSSVLKCGHDSTLFSVNKICDLDLNTAWIMCNNHFGIGDFFQFTIHFNKEEEMPYIFNGVCNVFNGYCKSDKAWKENSRVKKLKVYYNSTFVCFVELLDTYHLQYFDIGSCFKKKKCEIKDEAILKFEIVEVYPGDNYSNAAISEFLAVGSGN